LPDVVQRVDRAYHAFSRRVTAGETPGYPRFRGRNRYDSLTYPQFDNGARLENGCLVLAKIGRVDWARGLGAWIGRVALRWSRPLAGTPKTVTVSKEADGW
jgi:putative transposase